MEKYLLVFSSYNVYETFKRAFHLDPVVDPQTHIGTSVYQEKQMDLTVKRNRTFDEIRILVEPMQYDKVLILDHNIQDIIDMPLNWYVIHSLSQLEEALHVQCTTEQSYMLSRRSFQLRIPMPIVQLLQQIVGYDDDQVTRHAPETRTPLNAEWAAKIEEKEEEEKNDDNDETDPKCVICLTNDPCILLTPCSHQCVCDICVKEVLERDDQKKQCPVCRNEIKDIYKPIK